jgi:hypothetical protein
MVFQKFQVVTDPDREIEVSLGGKAYVKVMDRVNFNKYQASEEHEFHGEKGKVIQVTIRVPFLGRWFIIVDSGDGPKVSVGWRLLG